jgi:hypothetical protein
MNNDPNLHNASFSITNKILKATNNFRPSEDDDEVAGRFGAPRGIS